MFVIFLIAVAVQIAYALYFFIRVFKGFGTNEDLPRATAPVSIIVCAKNESENLKQFLPSVLGQVYKGKMGVTNFEVIVVDDGSTDDSERVLGEFQLRNSHLRILTIGEAPHRTMKGKKYALATGVAAAKHDLLLFTDTDCAPASDQWLAIMAAHAATGGKMIIGYGGYMERPGKLNAFIRWETLHTFLQYSSYALAGKPYMGVGRNMAVSKDLWNAEFAHLSTNSLPYGDDDLLVNMAGNKENTIVVFDKKAITRSVPKTTWREWAQQKKRHLSTGKYYKKDIQLLLGAYALSHAALWVSFFCLVSGSLQVETGIIMALRCGIYWGIWGYLAHELDEKKLVYLFPLADIGWMIYNFAFFPFIAWKDKKNWK